MTSFRPVPAANHVSSDSPSPLDQICGMSALHLQGLCEDCSDLCRITGAERAHGLGDDVFRR
jgi:hypothetical protein